MCEYQYEALGLYYGFPNCCVREFCDNSCQQTKNLYPDAPWYGTGFIPCSLCAEAAADFPAFVLSAIAPNRMCPGIFPHEGPEETFEAILELAREMDSARRHPVLTAIVSRAHKILNHLLLRSIPGHFC